MSETLEWSELSPRRFEEFCADVLWALGFTNVRRIGASGDRGRDILCEREIAYSEQFSDRFSWLVQCKHTPRLDKASLAKDLAAAIEHRPDVWWLMTSAHISPSFHDYLTNQSRFGLVPFRIGYVDGRLLSRLCVRFPSLVEKFLPRVAENRERTARAAMALMSQRRYADAAAKLSNSRYANWCRSQYLLACCFAQASARSRNKVKLDRAWAYLSQAIGRNYLTYAHAKFGWPLNRCRMQVFEDVELRPLRVHNEGKFRKTIGYSKDSGGGGKSGGCFPGNVAISTAAAHSPIRSLHPGDVVTSFWGTVAPVTSVVSHVRTKRATVLLKLNRRLLITPSQPIHTASGWRLAGDLQIGDILTRTGGPELLRDIESHESTASVYELTVEPHHQFYACDYLVHNKD